MAFSSRYPDLPFLGFGARLRSEYLPSLLEQKPDIDWFEVVAESHLEDDPATLRTLARLGERYPLVMHSLSLDLGSPWSLDQGYIEQLRRLMQYLEPAWISDHLCWSGADDLQGQMLSMPYTEDTLGHVVERITQVQELLGRQLLLENVPALQDKTMDIPEAEFLREVALRSDSLILVDIGNLHENSINQGIDPVNYLETLPKERVQQIHLSGATVLCESCGNTEPDPIWTLYMQAIERFGKVSTMIEREDTIPCFEALENTVTKARCAVGW